MKEKAPLCWLRVAALVAAVWGPWALIAIAAVWLSGCTAPPFFSDGPLAKGPAVTADLDAGTVHRADRVRSWGPWDCNDYAFANFQRLRADGRHPSYVVVIVPDGEAHMVVIDDGLVWSNSDAPIEWDLYPVRQWVARQDPETKLWHILEGAKS